MNQVSERNNDNTILVRNIKYSTDPQTLGTAFQRFGPIKECRIITRRTRGQIRSLGFGFVEFTTQEDKDKAVAAGSFELEGRNVRIHNARPPQKRERRTAFLGGVTEEISENDIKQKFPKAKTVTIYKPREGRRGYAFINFENNEDLMEAVKDVRETTINNVSLQVSIARSRPFRRGRRMARRN